MVIYEHRIAKSVDPDQTSPETDICSGSALFAQTIYPNFWKYHGKFPLSFGMHLSGTFGGLCHIDLLSKPVIWWL